MLWGRKTHQAAAFVARLQLEVGGDFAAQVRLAYRLTTSRGATDAEISRATAFVDKLKTKHQLSAEQALQQFGLFMLNLNEFVYLD